MFVEGSMDNPDDPKSKYFNNRGCALGFLYDGMVSENKKHNSSRISF